jgi:hypothetical protein
LAVALEWPFEHRTRRAAILNTVVAREIIGRARRAAPREIRRCADDGHSDRPHHPNRDHIRGGPVSWADPGIKPLFDDIGRRLGGVNFQLDIGKSR